MIAHEILKDDADLLPQVERIELANIDAVDQDRALGRIVEAAQKFDQSRLAGAVMSHQRDFLAGTDRQIDITQSPFVAFRIAKPDAAKFDAAATAKPATFCFGRRFAICGFSRENRK